MKTIERTKYIAFGVIGLSVLAGMIRATGQWVKDRPEWLYYRELVNTNLLDAMGPESPIFGYLPGFKALLIPFVATEPFGFFAFLLLNVLSCIGILVFVRTHFGSDRRDANGLLWLAFCSAVPIWFTLQNNQLVAPSVLLTLLTFSCMWKGREWSAGLLLVLAVLIKTLPLPILAFPLVRRQWRTVLVAGVALPVFSVGLAALTDGIDASVQSHIRWPEQVMAQDPAKLLDGAEPNSFGSNQSPSAEVVRLARSLDIELLVWLPKALSIAALFFLAYLSIKRQADKATFWSHAAAWLAWVAFAAPFGRYYYLLFIVPAAYCLGLTVFRRFPRQQRLWRVALCVVSLSLLAARGNNPVYALASSIILVLYLLLIGRDFMKDTDKRVDHYVPTVADDEFGIPASH